MIYQSLQEYATTHSLSERTVKRWLADEELPGQYKDEQGRWKIPHDAVRSPRMAGQVVAMTTRPVTQALSPMTAGLPPELTREVIDRLPTFLTLDQAAYLLDISRSTLANPHNRRYFRVRKVGHGLMMPLSRIKKLRGLTG